MASLRARLKMSTAAAAQGTAAAEVAAAAVAVPVPVAAPAAAPAGAAVVPEPSDAPGISQEQLRVWWEKFEAKVVTLANDARSLTVARFVAEVDD